MKKTLFVSTLLSEKLLCFPLPVHQPQNSTLSVLDQMYLLVSPCLLNDFQCINCHCSLLDIFVSLEESDNNGQIQSDGRQGLGTLQDSTFLPIVHGLFSIRTDQELISRTAFQLGSLETSRSPLRTQEHSSLTRTDSSKPTDKRASAV